MRSKLDIFKEEYNRAEYFDGVGVLTFYGELISSRSVEQVLKDKEYINKIKDILNVVEDINYDWVDSNYFGRVYWIFNTYDIYRGRELYKDIYKVEMRIGKSKGLRNIHYDITDYTNQVDTEFINDVLAVYKKEYKK